MAELLSTLAALTVCWVAWSALALSQRPHWHAAGSDDAYPPPGSLRKARVLSSLLLAGALAPCVAAHGAGFGTLLWMLLLAAGALATALVLAWRPRWLAPLAGCLASRISSRIL